MVADRHSGGAQTLGAPPLSLRRKAIVDNPGVREDTFGRRLKTGAGRAAQSEGATMGDKSEKSKNKNNKQKEDAKNKAAKKIQADKDSRAAIIKAKK
jgi:hypothetical protein